MGVRNGNSSKPVPHAGTICEVWSPMGLCLTLAGTLTDFDPQSEGDEAMLCSPALQSFWQPTSSKTRGAWR